MDDNNASSEINKKMASKIGLKNTTNGDKLRIDIKFEQNRYSSSRCISLQTVLLLQISEIITHSISICIDPCPVMVY